jgi:hypothetical protein
VIRGWDGIVEEPKSVAIYVGICIVEAATALTMVEFFRKGVMVVRHLAVLEPWRRRDWELTNGHLESGELGQWL